MSESLLSIEVEVSAEGGVETKTLQFKSLNVVPIGLLRRTRNDRTEQMWAVFEWAFTEDALALFDSLPGAQLMDILREMQKVSGADLGE